MRNHQSEEDYLERILVLQERNGKVRSIDIANDMNFSKPSISIAMKKLEEKKYIYVDNDTGFIFLTEEGKNIAEKIYHRHKTLTRIFIEIGVTPDVAEMDACKIEHDLTDETFEKLENHFKEN